MPRDVAEENRGKTLLEYWELTQVKTVGDHGLLVKDDPAEMAVQAKKCRRLAKWSNGSTRQALLAMAADYDDRERAAREREATGPTIKPDMPRPT